MKKNNALIFIICYIAYTSIYVARLNLSMASPGFIDAGLMDSAQIGALGSIFSIFFATGRLLNGGISDRQPPWKMICTGLVIAGISNILVGFLPPFAGIVFLWASNAYAQSMLWSSVLCVISSLYDVETAKKKNSYMVTAVATGNILGIIINTIIISHLGLRFAFIIPGALTIIMSTLVFFSIKHIIPANSDSKKHKSLLKLFLNKEIQLSMVPAVLHGVMKDNISLWMTVYFIDMFGVDLNKSAQFVLFIPAIGFIGRLIYPLCYKLCRNDEHKTAIYSFIACVVLTIPLFTKVGSPLIAAVCLSMLYAAVSVINTSIVSIYPVRFYKTGNVASVSGVLDFATYAGSGISSFIYGIIIKQYGYSPMFFSWAVISIISIIFLRILTKRTNPIKKQ